MEEWTPQSKTLDNLHQRLHVNIINIMEDWIYHCDMLQVKRKGDPSLTSWVQPARNQCRRVPLNTNLANQSGKTPQMMVWKLVRSSRNNRYESLCLVFGESNQDDQGCLLPLARPETRLKVVQIIYFFQNSLELRRQDPFSHLAQEQEILGSWLEIIQVLGV